MNRDAGIFPLRNLTRRRLSMGKGVRLVGSTLPLQAYTELAPGTDASINFVFATRTASKGPLVSLAATLAYRPVVDPAREETLTDQQKRQQVRTMLLTFPPWAVVDAQ